MPEVVSDVAPSAVRAAREVRVVVGRLRRRFKETYDNGDLTPSQISLLSRLDKDGAATASALAAAERVRPQSVAATLSALDERGLDPAIRLVSRQPSDRVARTYGIHVERARVLLAGALILHEAQQVLGVPLQVARGGLREGLADVLLAERSAA